MKRREFLAVLLVFLGNLLLPWSINAQQHLPEAQRPIIQRALVFLQFLDQRQVSKARAITTLYFRKNINPHLWRRFNRNYREKLGRTLARQVDGYKFHSTFEDAADGLYLQVRFATKFEARAKTVETVEMYKDFDGQWRVIGYFIK